MKERVINDNITIPSYNQSSIIAQPGESPLDLITTSITPHLAAIIVFLLFVIAPVRANHIDAPLFQSLTKPIAIISLVGNQAFGIFSGPEGVIALFVNISCPFPYIAMHVINALAVRFLLADRMERLAGILLGPGKCAGRLRGAERIKVL